MSTEPDPLFCSNHPNVETQLHCNNCNKPICAKCANPTPTGYRCDECIRGQQKKFNTATWYDFPAVFIILTVVSFFGALFTSVIANFFFGLLNVLFAPFAGMVLTEIARYIVKRRRSKRLFQISALAAALGSLPILLIQLIPIISGGAGHFGLWLSLFWQVFYTITVTSSVHIRQRGIQIR